MRRESRGKTHFIAFSLYFVLLNAHENKLELEPVQGVLRLSWDWHPRNLLKEYVGVTKGWMFLHLIRNPQRKA